MFQQRIRCQFDLSYWHFTQNVIMQSLNVRLWWSWLYSGIVKPLPAAMVLPDTTYNYEWVVPKGGGPTQNDADCITYLYYSAVDPIQDTNSGLVGPLLICKPKSLKSGKQVRVMDAEILPGPYRKRRLFRAHSVENWLHSLVVVEQRIKSTKTLHKQSNTRLGGCVNNLFSWVWLQNLCGPGCFQTKLYNNPVLTTFPILIFHRRGT